ncbi:MAG: hypothetical protein IJO28_03775 [Oscillospiraceae bacterium]|nr:hypothetical protein [Oscillospiraceae bacterium]
MKGNLIEDFLSMVKNGVSGDEQTVLIAGAIVFFIGLVLLLIEGKRLCGLFTILASIFHTLVLFVTVNQYATDTTLLICIAGAVILNLATWIAVSPFRAGEVFKGFFAGAFALALFSRVIPVIYSLFAEMLPFTGLVLSQCIVLILSSLLIFIAFRLSRGGSGDGRCYDTEYDGLTGLLREATGDEQMVDTVSMSDFDNH